MEERFKSVMRSLIKVIKPKGKEDMMKNKNRMRKLLLAAIEILMGVTFIFGITPSATAQPVTMPAQKDASVWLLYPNTNFGDSTTLDIIDSAPEFIARTLIQFDVSQILPETVIDSAKLHLFYYLYDDEGSLELGVYQVTTSWIEGGVTWNTRDGATPWTPGGDFNPMPEDIKTLGPCAGFYPNFVSWDITSLVQDWVGGTVPNHGVILKVPLETGGSPMVYKLFRSREWGIPSECPRLRVYYPSGPLPDLTITLLDPSNSNLSLGYNVTMDITVKNQGPAGSPPSPQCDLYFDFNLQSPLPMFQIIQIPALQPGQSRTLTTNQRTSWISEQWQCWAYVDHPVNQVIESDEGNNTRDCYINWGTAPPPDLKITDMTPILGSINGVNTFVRMAIEITNSGVGDAGTFDVDFYYNSATPPVATDPVSQTTTIANLPTQRSITWLTSFFTSATPGTWHTWAWADRVNAVVYESDNTNNMSGPKAIQWISSVDTWPMLQHDPVHTGYSLDYTIYPPLTLLWSRDLGEPISAPPVVGGTAETAVYVNRADGQVYKLDPNTGDIAPYLPDWPVDLGYSASGCPALGKGLVFVGLANGKLYALDENTGGTAWMFQAGGRVTDPIYWDLFAVYIGSTDNNVYKINPATGAQIWAFLTNSPIKGVAAKVDTGSLERVWAGTMDHYLYCIDDITGNLDWSKYLPPSYVYTPAMCYGNVYVSNNDSLYGVNCDGTRMWSIELPGLFAVAYHKVYVASYNNNTLYARNAITGLPVWSYSVTGYDFPVANPVVANGVVYAVFGREPPESKLVALDAYSGALLWQLTDTGLLYPVIAQGKLYISSSNGWIYCYEPGVGVAERPTDLRSHFNILFQNCPNPFNRLTSVGYKISNFCHTTLKIYDISGRLVRALVDDHKTVGIHTAYWNGSDATGKEVPNGVYFYKLQTGNYTETRKMILLR